LGEIFKLISIDSNKIRRNISSDVWQSGKYSDQYVHSTNAENYVPWFYISFEL